VVVGHGRTKGNNPVEKHVQITVEGGNGSQRSSRWSESDDTGVPIVFLQVRERFGGCQNKQRLGTLVRPKWLHGAVGVFFCVVG